MNNNFNLKQYLAENLLLKEIEVRTFVSTRLNLPKDLDREINSDSNDDYENIIAELIKLNPQIPEKYFTNVMFGEVGSGINGQADHYGPMSLKDYLWELFYWVYAVAVTENLNYDDYNDDGSYEDAQNQRVQEFGNRREEFADSAMRGQWLVVPEITDLTDSYYNSLNEIEVGLPGAVIKVTNKPYKALNPELNNFLIDSIYSIEENNGRSEVFDAPLKEVIEDLRNNSNLLYSGIITPNDIVYKTKYLAYILSEDENDFDIEDIQILVNLYNNNDDQGLLDYFVSNYGLTQGEDDYLIDESNGETYPINDIKQDIKDYFVPFISAYNELGDSYTIISGDYATEEYLVETDDESIIYKESLFNSDFDTSLSTFDKRGNLVVKGDIERENPMVF
jgi:hypothetical protein